MKQAAGGNKADKNNLKLKRGKPMRRKARGERSLTDTFPWNYTTHGFLVIFLELSTWKKVILQMNIYRPCSSPFFVLSFYYLLSLIAGRHKISFVFIALPPRPFEQARDKYNEDGLDALYHHLELALYESRSHITMKYSSTPLYPSLSSPTLIHGMRLTNPMICLIIWSQIWA